MTTIVLPADETLSLPAKQPADLPFEESSVVEQFIENSKGIVPGLQVTLARRVVMPGSKKVLCMAAHTSVPLNDDEVSSVSQLALRLSDGTSCLLSLQFFNDTTGSEYVPPTYNSFVYDPERYNTVQGQSNLGIFLVATALCAIVCFYHVAKNNIPSNVQSKPITKSVSSLSRVAAPKPALKPSLKPTNASTAKASQPREAVSPVKQSTHPTITAKAPHASSASHARATQAVRSPVQQFFVPPPPPMVYSWPAARQFGFPPPDQVPAQITPPPAAKPALKTKPTADFTTAKTAPATLQAVKSATVQVQKSTDPDIQFIPLQEPRHSTPLTRVAVPMQRPPIVLNPGDSAPAPGIENNIPLERIVLPNQ
jgi:hypothetical protein